MKRNMAKYLSVISLALVAAVAIGGVDLASTKAQERNYSGDKIPGQYIVVFKDSVSDPEAETLDMERTLRFTHFQTYSHILKGFAAVISDNELERIKKDPRVQFVSEDREVSIARRVGDSVTQPVQSVPTGISRINSLSASNAGSGVTVAVIDTGIDLTHPDMSGKIVANKNCLSSRKNGNDDNGHGTHVAGTIAALNNSIGVVGVAPEANLAAVKVLNSRGSGTWSSVICGIDWVTANAAKYNIKVANMSLGGGGSSDNNCGNSNGDALHKAICKSRDAGVTYVVAAGNEGDNAANHVPSAYDDAVITVSALVDTDGISGGLGSGTSYGADDTFASFSNYGSVVDIGAPGVNILSTWKGGGYNTISGTSMATPHVSGAAALYIAANPGSSWTAVRDALVSAGEAKDAGHTDPSGNHPEPVLQAGSL